MRNAWRLGLWDARWFQDFDRGYGYPFLSYYAPLFHWISGALTAVLGTPVLAVQWNAALWLMLGTIGCYLAGAEVWRGAHPLLTRRLCGFLTASGWLMSAYPLCNVYVRGALSEFAASQMLPWLVYVTWRYFARPYPPAALVMFVPALSLAILAHNFIGLCAFAFTLLIGLVAIAARVLGERRLTPETRRPSAGWAGAIALALGCTIFYWYPALREQKYADLQKVLAYHYYDHFLLPSNLLRVGFWAFGDSVAGPDDQMPLHLGYVSIFAITASILQLGALCETLDTSDDADLTVTRRYPFCCPIYDVCYASRLGPTFALTNGTVSMAPALVRRLGSGAFDARDCPGRRILHAAQV